MPATCSSKVFTREEITLPFSRMLQDRGVTGGQSILPKGAAGSVWGGSCFIRKDPRGPGAEIMPMGKVERWVSFGKG